MLNYIWLALVLLAVAISGWNDRWKELTDGAFDGAKTAVTIALGLIGVMALWLGVMRLAERAGLVQKIARALRPVMQRLFPDVPDDHPAMGTMLMNMAANMLGLGNAATPLGLRAMRDLEALNPHPGIATNAMCTFLAINTASVQLIPTTAIAILVAAGSTRPTAIVGTALLATLCAATAAIIGVKTLEKFPWFAVRTQMETAASREPTAPEAAVVLATPELPVVPHRASWLGLTATIALLLFFALVFVRMVWPQLFSRPIASDANLFIRSVNALSLLAIPFLLSFFPVYASTRGVKVYEEFVEGAKEGFNVILRIIPFLVAMLVAIGMFKGAGGIDLLTRLLTPVLAPLQFSPGSPAARADAPFKRKCDARRAGGYRPSARAGQYRESDGSHGLWKHRDHLLRGGGLFRLSRGKADAPRDSGWSARGPRWCSGIRGDLSRRPLRPLPLRTAAATSRR